MVASNASAVISRYRRSTSLDPQGLTEADTARQCDESRPVCANCNISNRHCSYEDLVSKAYTLVKSPSKLPTSRGPKGADKTTLKSPSRSSIDAGTANDSLPVNKLHLELFHHFIFEILTVVGFERLSDGCSTVKMIKIILTAPFLMNQILAFAALHLSIIRPLQRKFYRDHAAQLQTHALSEFNGANMDLTPDTCLPMFLFSSILALHMLSEKLVYCKDAFEDFLDDFIQSLRLYRGVRAVTNQSWHLLRESPLKSVLEVEAHALDQGVSEHECLELMSRIESSPLDSNIKDIYRQAIEYLQKAINASHTHPSKLSTIGPILSWPVIIPDQYIDFLSERRPQALVILSYFGALLHLHRDMWTFGDGGLYIISSVKGYLGPSWADWLRWPNQVMDEPSIMSEIDGYPTHK
ncbi:hypothetical protein KXV52_001226 [Aspergillus fumigatus]|nr:hypothetical protein KXV52_001226 [Aspergillus fumigatus]